MSAHQPSNSTNDALKALAAARACLRRSSTSSPEAEARAADRLKHFIGPATRPGDLPRHHE
jgi:hypothetical protein